MKKIVLALTAVTLMASATMPAFALTPAQQKAAQQKAEFQEVGKPKPVKPPATGGGGGGSKKS